MKWNNYIKKHSYYAVLFYLTVFSNKAVSQQQYNLVPNHSFESYTNCPTSATFELSKASKPDEWYKPDKRGAGYFNACSPITEYSVPHHVIIGGPGFQYARTGIAYVGMFYYNGGNARNYFQVKMNDSLRSGKCYYAECYVNLGNSFQRACNNQSILLTQNPIYADTANGQEYILANPQVTNFANAIITDTLNWIKVSGVFVAQGGEQYLTIGNFKNNAQTNSLVVNPSGGYNGAVYYVDDVSVIPLDSMPLPADAGADRTIQQGQSTYVGSYTNGLSNITWYNSTGAVIATGVPGLNVTPNANTFYVIEQTVCGNYSRDTVHVYVQPVPLNFIDYTVQLAGENKVHNKWTTANEVNVSHFNIQRSKDGVTFHTIGKTFAKNGLMNEYLFTDEYPFPGLNYYRIVSVDKDGKPIYSSVQQVKVNEAMAAILLYPNPAKDVVTIEARDIQRVIITDVTGKLVVNRPFSAGTLVQIDISALSPGIYMVRVFSANHSMQTRKLLIE